VLDEADVGDRAALRNAGADVAHAQPAVAHPQATAGRSYVGPLIPRLHKARLPGLSLNKSWLTPCSRWLQRSEPRRMSLTNALPYQRDTATRLIIQGLWTLQFSHRDETATPCCSLAALHGSTRTRRQLLRCLAELAIQSQCCFLRPPRASSASKLAG
jgi:hypothetical protein